MVESKSRVATDRASRARDRVNQAESLQHTRWTSRISASPFFLRHILLQFVAFLCWRNMVYMCWDSKPIADKNIQPHDVMACGSLNETFFLDLVPQALTWVSYRLWAPYERIFMTLFFTKYLQSWSRPSKSWSCNICSCLQSRSPSQVMIKVMLDAHSSSRDHMAFGP